MRRVPTPTAMRVVLLLLAVVLLLPVFMAPAIVLADDPLEGLTDDEKAYVAKMRQAYSNARAATAALQKKVNEAVAGAIFGGGPGAPELIGYLANCNIVLDGTAATLRESPPQYFQDLASTNAGIAATLEASLRPCNAMVVEEGANRIYQTGRNFLASLMGAEQRDADTDAVTKAKIAACISDECANVNAALDAGEAALNAQIQLVQEQQKLGEDFLDAFLGDCFIATAAYGTKSAAEIEVLRKFRDEVLMASPAGRDYVGFYYAASPPIADFISRHECLRTVVREAVIDPIVTIVDWTSTSWSNP